MTMIMLCQVVATIISMARTLYFEYTPAADITVDITLTNTDTWTGINVSLGCPDVGTCVGYAGSSTGNPIYAGLNLLGGNTYYILIGTWPTPDFTPFDIAINVN